MASFIALVQALCEISVDCSSPGQLALYLSMRWMKMGGALIIPISMYTYIFLL